MPAQLVEERKGIPREMIYTVEQEMFSEVRRRFPGRRIMAPHLILQPSGNWTIQISLHTIDLGFTGTQDGMTRWQSQAVFDEMMSMNLASAHHGCCVGADEEFDAMLAYADKSVTVYGHPPLNQTKMALCQCDIFLEPRDYLDRNRDIVDVTNFLIAAPKGPEETRSGTWSTVRYARRKGRPITIVMPDATIIRERQ